MTAIVAPPTAPGAQTLAHAFSQAVSSNEWDITHALGFRPNVTVIDSANTMAYGFVIEHVSVNRLILTFNAPFTGTAYLS